MDEEKKLNTNVTNHGIHLSHEIFSNIPSEYVDDKILEIIHADLFNENDDISQRAFELLELHGDEKSHAYLFQILKEYPKERKLYAIKAFEKIGDSKIIKPLYDYFQMNFDEEIRVAILKVLALYGGDEPYVRELILSYSDEELHESPLRIAAVENLARVDELDTVKDLLSHKSDKILIAAVNTLSQDKNIDALFLLKRMVSLFDEYSDTVKVAIIKGLLSQNYEAVFELISTIFTKDNQKVIGLIIDGLNEHFDFVSQYPVRLVNIFIKAPTFSPWLEDKIVEIYIRLCKYAKHQDQVLKIALMTEQALKSFYPKVKNKFKAISTGYSSLEINVSQAKDYIEKYGSQELLDLIMAYFKLPPDTKNSIILLKKIKMILTEMSKETSEEYATHLRSLKLLLDSRDKWERNRIATSIPNVDFSKKDFIGKLNRFVEFVSYFKDRNLAHLAFEIYAWSSDKKEIRLQSSSLLASARCKHKNVIKEAGRIFSYSKNEELIMIAIKALGELASDEGLEPLLKFLNEKKIENLNDEILISAVEAMIKINVKNNYEVEQVLLKILSESKSDSVRFNAVLAIAELSSPKVINILAKYKNSENSKIREFIVHVIGKLAEKHNIENSIVQNFLYPMLKDADYNVKLSIIVVLYRLNDNYAITILKDMFEDPDPTVIADTIIATTEIDTEERLKLMQHYIGNDSDNIFSALTHAYTSLVKGGSQNTQIILNSIIEYRTVDAAIKEGVSSEELTPAKFDLQQSVEKEKYKFEREHTKELSILFVDIIGYTKRSSEMELMDIVNYLKNYEELTIPTFTSHKGNIVKKMGDGLMVSFEHPVFAVLSALRLQEKLKKYNLFKPDKSKIEVRVGINTGPVAVRENDMYGDTVNVASRLETLADAGTIVISESTQTRIKNYFQLRELETTKVKGKDKPLRIFEAINISAALPDTIDPLKTRIENVSQVDEELSPVNNGSTETEEMTVLSDKSKVVVKSSFGRLLKSIERVKNDNERGLLKKAILVEWGKIKKEFDI